MKNLYHPLLLLIAGSTQKQLASQIRYLRIEDQILRSRLPFRVTVTEQERNWLVKFGSKLELGHVPLTVAGMATALDQAATWIPDLLLVDLTAPSIDGVTLARRIRQTPETAARPLVGLVGYMGGEDRRQAIEAGFDEFLPKPSKPNELSSILVRVEARIAASKATVDKAHDIAKASRELNQKAQEGLTVYRRNREPTTFKELMERFETSHVLRGRIKKIIDGKQLGFIHSPGRPDTLFFASNVADGQFADLSEGQEVDFVLQPGRSRARSVKRTQGER